MSQATILLSLCDKACSDGEYLIALKIFSLLQASPSPTRSGSTEGSDRNHADDGHRESVSAVSSSIRNCIIDVLCRIQDDETFEVVPDNELYRQLQLIRRTYANQSDVLLLLSNIFFRSELHFDALEIAQEAAALDLGNASALETFENMCCHVMDRWHFIMLNDLSRNKAYQQALYTVITGRQCDTKVLDVGCGTGLLSFLAAKWGRMVYAVERSPLMCQIAQNTLRSSGVDRDILDRISVINKMSTDLKVLTDLPDRVDVLVTEIFDAGLFGEGIVSTLTHAWKLLLKSDDDDSGKKSVVIPFGATVFVQGIESVDIRRESHLSAWNNNLTRGDIDIVSNVGMLESDPYTSVRVDSLPSDYKSVTERTPLMTVDFNDPKNIFELNEGLVSSLVLDATSDGVLDALCVSFRLHLTDSIEISTEVGRAGCWEQAIFPVSGVKLNRTPVSSDQSSSCSLAVQAGDKLSVIYSVREDRLSLGVASIKTQCDKVLAVHKPPEFPSAYQLLSHPLAWCPHNVYCLSDWEIKALNNRQYQDAMLVAVRAYQQSVKNRISKCRFVHVNDGFSPLSLQALSCGFNTVHVLTPQDSHKALLWKLVQLNKLDLDRIKTMEDISELGDDMTNNNDDDTDDECASSQARSTETDGLFIIFDVVDHTGRLVENWMDKLDIVKLYSSQFTDVSISPAVVDVWGVLIESDALMSRNRIVSNDNVLGFPVKDKINRYATMNHPDICLSTLKHTKLTSSFKISTLNFLAEVDKNKQSNKFDERQGASCLSDVDKADAHSRCSNLFKDQINDVKVNTIAEGRIDALVYWFDLQLSPHHKVSTLDSTHHWHQASIVFNQGRIVGEGKDLQLKTSVRNSTVFVSFLD